MCANILILYLFSSYWLTSLCITGSRFIHLTKSDSNSFFLWLSNIPLCIYISPPLPYPFICRWTSIYLDGWTSIYLDGWTPIYLDGWTSIYLPMDVHLSADGRRGCFLVLVIVNSAALSVGAHVSFIIVAFSGYMPSRGLLGPKGPLFYLLSFQYSLFLS